MKKIFLDTETTGLSAYKNSLIQIAFLVTVDDQLVEEGDFQLKPKHETQFDQNAMQKIGKTPTQLFDEGSDRKEVKEKFTSILKGYVDPFDKKDKFHLYAYNSPFDTDFLRSFWVEQGDKYFGSFFWTPDICIMRMAMEVIGAKRNLLENFRLGTVCNHFGVKFDEAEAHDARYDVRKTYNLYRVLTKGGE
jgi:DNA polymerase-3 subunit epsilon